MAGMRKRLIMKRVTPIEVDEVSLVNEKLKSIIDSSLGIRNYRCTVSLVTGKDGFGCATLELSLTKWNERLSIVLCLIASP